ncbi:MAG: response regulator [Bacteroidales bacterium]
MADLQTGNNFLQTAPLGYARHQIVLDEEGRAVDYVFLELNDAFETLTGLKKGACLNKRATEVLPGIVREDSAWIESFGEIALHGGEKVFERFFATLGRWFHVHVYSTEKGFFTTLFTALSKEKQQAQKAFLANLSHEIRTPMNGILGFAELLKDPRITSDQQMNFIGIIEKSGARILHIINDLVDLSKIEAGQMEVNRKHTDLGEQMNFVYGLFKPQLDNKKPPVALELSMPQQSVWIDTDRNKLKTILVNLLKNAETYTKAGSVSFGFEIKGDVLEFFVRDTGIGISKDKLDEIFDSYYRNDPDVVGPRENGGLGLAIAKGYVELLGGRIWAESEPGKGSCFWFTLPLRGAGSTEGLREKDGQLTGRVKKGPLKILIAEDDLPSVEIIQYMLEGIDHELIHVETGEDAVAACRNMADIDLVLMDIRMPGMNGYEATREIRTFNKDLVIIAQTAHALYGDKEKALAAGCDDYLSKPIKRQALRDKILSRFS